MSDREPNNNNKIGNFLSLWKLKGQRGVYIHWVEVKGTDPESGQIPKLVASRITIRIHLWACEPI